MTNRLTLRISQIQRGLIIGLLLGNMVTHLFAAENTVQSASPLAVVKLIGDKLIRDTPFKYELSLPQNNNEFNCMQVVDFGRTLLYNKPAVAYAFTQLKVNKETDIVIEIEHNDGCKVWVNGAEVYSKAGDRKINLIYDERSVIMSNSFPVHLKKGNNNFLIKSETNGDEWKVYIQPPSDKGAVKKCVEYPKIGLNETPNLDPAITKFTNWLVIGPFRNDILNGVRTGLNTKYAPESELVFGRMYAGQTEPITWTIPKVEVLGKLINPLVWGTNYTWNYHNGGVAWAMQQLSELSGEKKYDDYATNFCDFHLNGLPFVEYQVKELNAISSDNSYIVDSKLLDFTTAPTLPLVYKLLKDSAFKNRHDYEKFVGRIMNYAKNEQIRLPGSGIFTRTTPVKYTTWVDDMFMGIPFLVQASKYAKTTEEKNAFLNDAASQVLGFQNEVWDKDAQLYMHAHYSTDGVKLPHWSRANGWAIWATTEVLLNLPKSHPNYKAILAQYRKHVESLVRFQNKNGFWYNVIDRTDSKEEESGTAIFTMAIARGVSNGWLDAKKYTPVALKGWEAVKSNIEPDGTVNSICMGTMCSEDVNYYLNRPFLKNDTHGLFAVLFAGIEVEKMMHKIK